MFQTVQRIDDGGSSNQAVIRIPNEEFKEFLTICLRWFEKQENYEKCRYRLVLI